MKVLTESIVRFAAGETLPPDDVNRPFLYAADAIDDVAQRRWAKSTLSLPWVESVATPYTQASAAVLRRYYFRCPIQCAIERAFLNANLTASGGPAEWAITKTGAGSTPPGASAPWVTTRGGIITPSDGTDPSESADGTVAASTSTLTAQNTNRVELSPDTEYQIDLTGSTFSLERADLLMHLAVDRWMASGTLNEPSFTPTLLRTASAPNGTTVAANQSALNTQAAKFSTSVGMTPFLFVRHGLTSTTDVDLRTFALPRFATARARARVVRIYSWAAMSAAATATLGVQLRNAGGGVIATANISLVAATEGSGDSGALSLSLTGASSSTTTDDYTVVFDSSTATNALKVYCLVWVAWS